MALWPRSWFARSAQVGGNKHKRFLFTATGAAGPAAATSNARRHSDGLPARRDGVRCSPIPAPNDGSTHDARYNGSRCTAAAATTAAVGRKCELQTAAAATSATEIARNATDGAFIGKPTKPAYPSPATVVEHAANAISAAAPAAHK